jgi:hypothetical protein
MEIVNGKADQHRGPALVAALLAACAGSSHRYATANSGASAAPVAYPSSANGANNPAVSFDATGYNRQAIDAAANS